MQDGAYRRTELSGFSTIDSIENYGDDSVSAQSSLLDSHLSRLQSCEHGVQIEHVALDAIVLESRAHKTPHGSLVAWQQRVAQRLSQRLNESPDFG